MPSLIWKICAYYILLGVTQQAILNCKIALRDAILLTQFTLTAEQVSTNERRGVTDFKISIYPIFPQEAGQ